NIETSTSQNDFEKVEFYVDGDLEKSQYNEPYSYPWNKTIWNYTEVFFKHYIEILAYDHFENIAFDQQTVWRIL
ncbi:unnamed protein product, partial [marine sediment metagenome]